MRNPTRRSKRIGQTQGGRVSDGKAQEKRSRIFTRTTWTKLSAHEDGTLIVRENPSRDLFHPASPDDVRRVLDRLPYVETVHVKAVILRRTPKDDLRERTASSARTLTPGWLGTQVGLERRLDN